MSEDNCDEEPKKLLDRILLAVSVEDASGKRIDPSAIRYDHRDDKWYLDSEEERKPFIVTDERRLDIVRFRVEPVATTKKIYTKRAGSSPDAFRGWLEAEGASFERTTLDAFLDAFWEDERDQVFVVHLYGGVGKSGKTLNSQAFLRLRDR